MIRTIKFSNFYSFKDEYSVDFTTNKKNSANYFNTFDGKQISKVISFVGPNNSGKTNMMKLLGFLDFFLSHSSREDDGFGLGFKSYAFCKSKPSKFELEFETINRLYSYKLTASVNEVIKESLSAKKLEKNSKPYKLFDRTNNEIDVNKKVVLGTTKKQLSSIRSDVSTVAFLNANYDIDELLEVGDYFGRFRTNINEEGDSLPVSSMTKFSGTVYSIFPELKERMEDFMKDFDLGIDSFEIETDKDDRAVNINAVHVIDGEKYVLPLNYESKGTQYLFAGLFDILASIEEGTVLAIDEIESGLHPHAVNKLIRFIVDEFSEEKRQFIFSSHSIDFLKRFDSQQMFFVEKEDNVSTVFRLDELGVRPEENFLAKYMSGAYGAFPKIRI